MFKNKIKLLIYIKHNLQNLILTSNIQKKNLATRNILIRGCKLSELNEVENLYNNLNGSSFSPINKCLLMIISKKNLIIAIDESTNKIIAMNFYYINQRDFFENTIHEGFIGVLPEYEGQGIATNMREHAKSHFKISNFSGISSRVSKNNLASFQSAKKAGFKPIEEYYDEVLDQERFYLICNLEKENDI